MPDRPRWREPGHIVHLQFDPDLPGGQQRSPSLERRRHHPPTHHRAEVFDDPGGVYRRPSIFSPFSKFHGYWYYNWDYFVKTSGSPPPGLEQRPHPEPARWMVSCIGPNGTESLRVVGNNVILWLEYDPPTD